MDFAICSFSFHRTYADRGWDARQFAVDCHQLGIRRLDPWNAHLIPGANGLRAGSAPSASGYLEPVADAFYDELARIASDHGQYYGLIAIDGAHIYEQDPAVRTANRERAYRWLDVAARLDARQVRIDAGGRDGWSEEEFDAIVDGYHEVIAYASNMNIEVLVENHWGPSTNPDEMNRLLDAVPRLGLLFDTNNWIPARRREAWDKCAHRAVASHVKTFSFDDAGAETSGQDVAYAIRKLDKEGYRGVWGIESVPSDRDEYEGVRETMRFIRTALDSPTAYILSPES